VEDVTLTVEELIAVIILIPRKMSPVTAVVPASALMLLLILIIAAAVAIFALWGELVLMGYVKTQPVFQERSFAMAAVQNLLLIIIAAAAVMFAQGQSLRHAVLIKMGLEIQDVLI